jgi:TrmH family RNA methyltransferase
MGAIFAVPVVRASNIGDLPGRKVALAARTGRALSEVDATELTLVVGAEREGLPDGVLASCNETAHIPIRSESLNAAMAATIGLYEVTRVARA